MAFLEQINTPEDVKRLSIQELDALSEEIRHFLIESLSKSGGHLASNLGAVELTLAVHKVFDTATDRLIFDVGHQCYTHKLLTGRREAFATLRGFGGLSGFPKSHESVHDAFVAGHASTSISVALGMARARALTGGDYHVISVIGDGALSGGLAYEALNDAGQSGEKMIILLNDNAMSINRSVGGMTKMLGRMRLKPQYAKFKNWFRRQTAKLPGGHHVYRFVHRAKEGLKSLLLPRNMF
ncbi:thiamine pyrophosphate-dependent enzyme, partial [Oscillospiraceae bacterium OttesenSCG-928-F05]|nr:thiamine pyrophosphate-dependent enzyme [Oscillospiraceae bacterium OttesenSCG-928-F05]